MVAFKYHLSNSDDFNLNLIKSLPEFIFNIKVNTKIILYGNTYYIESIYINNGYLQFKFLNCPTPFILTGDEITYIYKQTRQFKLRGDYD